MASERLQVYKCAKCGITAQVLDGGPGVLSCCGQPMQRLQENTVDASKEKHVPVIERVQGGVKVKVGSVPHPMEAAHFISWIELVAGGKVCRQFLQPGQAPEAFFPVSDENVVVCEYCNLHGMWKA